MNADRQPGSMYPVLSYLSILSILSIVSTPSITTEKGEGVRSPSRCLAHAIHQSKHLGRLATAAPCILLTPP